MPRKKGYCSEPLAHRFWRNVRITSGCWLWTAALVRGYGYTTIHGRNNKTYAHRIAWMFYHGWIPEGMHVLHRCDNPPCVNPDHLFLGTQADNMRDMLQKGRNYRPVGELSRTAKLTEADVLAIREQIGTGKVTRTDLARHYGVNPSTISYAASGTTWRHLSVTP